MDSRGKDALMTKMNIVHHGKGPDVWKRQPQQSYIFSIDSKPRYVKYVDYEKATTIEEIAEDLYRRNAKANRLFKYKIVDGKIIWKLLYPSIKRTTTGYIKPHKGKYYRRTKAEDRRLAWEKQ